MGLAAAAIALPAPQPAMAQYGVSNQVGDGQDRQRAVACLTLAIAYEAGFEPDMGKQAVAEVVINRMRAPAYPKSICGVVFSGSSRTTGCQFSFTCDGSLARPLRPAVLQSARIVAEAALDGVSPVHVAGATHYHADYVSPYWAPSLSRIGSIGRHIFYRPPGARDQPATPVAITVFAEPTIAKMAGFDASFAAAASAPLTPSPARPSPQAPAFAPWGLAIVANSSR